jgi:cyclic pyranopterin phosphate synthase
MLAAITVRRVVSTRTPLFRTLTSLRAFNSSGSKPPPPPLDPAASHGDFQSQMAELADERQALFGFSDEEVSGWGSRDNVNSPPSGSGFSDDMQKLNEMLQNPESHHMYDDTTDQDINHGDLHGDDRPYGSDDEPYGFTHLTQTKGTSSGAPSQTTFKMVDVSPKIETKRTATAVASISLPPVISDAFRASGIDQGGPATAKGAVFDVARLAGIMGVKQTSTLIPLCHPLSINHASVDLCFPSAFGAIDYSTINVTCSVSCSGKTGVEMEALTGASVAALTVYDMVKGISHECTIGGVKVVGKDGGKRLVRDGKNIN